jgi:alkylation response protein AidB-like acyl-CoA dehydrogenase
MTVATPPPAQLAKAAERVAELAREQAPFTERERALSDELVGALRRTGLRAGAPAKIGGLEAPPAVLLASAERIARGDASTGWCVSIAATASLLAGLSLQGRRAGDPRRPG